MPLLTPAPENYPPLVAYKAISRAVLQQSITRGTLPMEELAQYDRLQRIIHATAELAGFDLM